MTPLMRCAPRIAQPFMSEPRLSASVSASKTRQAQNPNSPMAIRTSQTLPNGCDTRRLQGAAAAAGLSAGTDGGEKRQGTDEAIDHASCAIAEPGQGFDRIAAEIGHG